MRLINTWTLELEGFSSSKNTPPYAILSHTWGNDEDEVSFEDLKPNSRLSQLEKKAEFEKIRMTCQLAREEWNLEYAWVDTCCIDKSSSAELSESINSMFTWWFTRGWTLQELVASETLIFYDKTWQARGNKSTCCAEIARITRISEEVLTGETQLTNVPVAVRLSWAAGRSTTREEDIAYSLLGIFDLNMPMLYGEGHKAFLRLQEEIIKNIADLSIFAWKALPEACQDYMGMLAPSPREFKDLSRMYYATSKDIKYNAITFSMSNRGVEFSGPLQFDNSIGCFILPLLHGDLLPDGPTGSFSIRKSCGVCLRMIERRVFVRARPYLLAYFPIGGYGHTNYPFWAFKSLSAKDSDAVSRREITVRGPENLKPFDLHPFNGYGIIHPSYLGTSYLCTLIATRNEPSMTRVCFTRTYGFQIFALSCQFSNLRGAPFSPGFWKCNVAEGFDASVAVDDILADNFLSSQDGAPSLVTKTLALQNLQGDSKTGRLVLSLKREHNVKNGHTQFFIDLQIEDGD